MLNKVVFLDRDGVINKVAAPHDYIKTWNEFELFDGVATAIKKLNDAQYIVCVVTNQRGVAQGIMSMEDVNEIHKQMQCKDKISQRLLKSQIKKYRIIGFCLKYNLMELYESIYSLYRKIFWNDFL